MPAGNTILLCSASPHRVLLQLRLLPDAGRVEIGFTTDLDAGCTWLVGPDGGDCCETDPRALEREWWYGRHGGLMQQALYGRMTDSTQPAIVQIHETMYSSYIRDRCGDEKAAEQFGLPAGAEPHYWYRCNRIAL